MIVERICACKSGLYLAFAEVDVHKCGVITKLQWARVLGSALHLEAVPWLTLAHLLVGTLQRGAASYSCLMAVCVLRLLVQGCVVLL